MRHPLFLLFDNENRSDEGKTEVCYQCNRAMMMQEWTSMWKCPPLGVQIQSKSPCCVRNQCRHLNKPHPGSSRAWYHPCWWPLLPGTGEGRTNRRFHPLHLYINIIQILHTRMYHTRYKCLHKKILPLSSKVSVSLKRTFNLDELLGGEGLTRLDSSGHALFFKMEMRPLEGKVYNNNEGRYSLNAVHPSTLGKSVALVCLTTTNQDHTD